MSNLEWVEVIAKQCFKDSEYTMWYLKDCETNQVLSIVSPGTKGEISSGTLSKPNTPITFWNVCLGDESETGNIFDDLASAKKYAEENYKTLEAI